MEYLGVADMDLAELARFPGNARRHADDRLRASVRRFGQFRTIVVRKHSVDDVEIFTILAGNGTADALQAEGHGTARAELISCSDQEATMINLADNRLSDLAEDNPRDLAALLQSIDSFDLDATGWDEDDLAKLLAGPESDLPQPGDADEDPLTMTYGVIIDCATESEQIRLLEELSGQGLAVRALMT